MRRARGLLLLILLGSVAGADEVVLTSGGRLSCEVLEETETTVTVRLPHGTMVIPRTRIDRIEREDRGRYLKREARQSMKSGSTGSAVDLYERAFRAAPRDAEARRGLVDALCAHARSLVAQFRLDEADAVVARLRALDADPTRIAAAVTKERKTAATLLARARSLLDAKDFKRALLYLDAWRVRRPVDDAKARDAMAAAHVGAARQAADRGDLRGALDHLRAARTYGAHDVDQTLYLLQPVAVLEELREGDFEGARRLLDGISTTYPDSAVPMFLRAVTHHLRGEVSEAVAAYAEAARLAERGRKPRTGCSYELVKKYATATLRAAIARPPQEGVAKWRELFLGSLEREESRHFVVFASSAKRAAEVGAAADVAYTAIARALLGGIPSTAKAEIVVHPGRQAYLAADPEPPGAPVQGAALDRGQTSGVCYDTLDEHGRRLVRVEIFDGQPGLMEDTLPHELVHVVQRRGLTAFRRGKWLDEGLAMLFESREGQANRLGMWRTLARNPIPLPELLTLRSIPPGKATVFYQQSHAFTVFLNGLGDERDWRRFLDTFGRADLATALRQAYDVESIADLERLWVEHIGR